MAASFCRRCGYSVEIASGPPNGSVGATAPVSRRPARSAAAVGVVVALMVAVFGPLATLSRRDDAVPAVDAPAPFPHFVPAKSLSPPRMTFPLTDPRLYSPSVPNAIGYQPTTIQDFAPDHAVTAYPGRPTLGCHASQPGATNGAK